MSSEIVHQEDIREEAKDNQEKIGQSIEEFSATQPKITENSAEQPDYIGI